MSSSKNEFFVGCLLGGILGAVAAMLVPKNLLNGVMPGTPRENSSRAHKKAHANAAAHPKHTAHKVRKKRATRATASKSTAHTKGGA